MKSAETRRPLERGHIILIAGTALFIAGIVITAVFVTSFASSFFQESTIVTKATIAPKVSTSSAIELEEGGNFALVLASEPSEVPMNIQIKDPEGNVVSDLKFSGELITTLGGVESGKYSFVITNLGTESVTIESIFGKAPFIDGELNPAIRAVGWVVSGTGLILGGIVVLVVGGILLTLDRRKEGISAGEPHELHIAKWSDRFFAWLIDFAIVMVMVETIVRVASGSFWLDGDPARWFSSASSSMDYLIRSVAFFAYWIYFETTRGQSIGKMILNLKTVDLAGKNADLRSVAISSFGKAFLLPIDLILGWIFTNEKRQRIFNKLSNTIVIKVKHHEAPSDVRYTKE